MWNNRRRQEELMAKLDEQSSMLAQMQSIINEIQRKVDEQGASQRELKSEWTQQVAELQGQFGALETQAKDTQRHLDELTDVNRGLERGITDGGSWSQIPSDNAFWQKSDEVRQPFYVPFSPQLELMLWIGHARFPMQPLTSIILPKSYAKRAFVHFPPSGETPTVHLSESDLDTLPDGESYVALMLNGHAAPPTWINTLLKLNTQPDLNMWLVWFLEPTSGADRRHARVAVARCCAGSVSPTDWEGHKLIYFERLPSREYMVPIFRVPVITDDSSDDGLGEDPTQESPAN